MVFVKRATLEFSYGLLVERSENLLWMRECPRHGYEPADVHGALMPTSALANSRGLPAMRGDLADADLPNAALHDAAFLAADAAPHAARLLADSFSPLGTVPQSSVFNVGRSVTGDAAQRVSFPRGHTAQLGSDGLYTLKVCALRGAD